MDGVLCGERMSLVQGDGGMELARNCISVGRLRALELRVACFEIGTGEENNKKI